MTVNFLLSLTQALSKALREDELLYLRLQFKLLEPRDGFVSLDNFRTVSYEDMAKAEHLLRFSCAYHVACSNL